jgi:hypothetical protein
MPPAVFLYSESFWLIPAFRVAGVKFLFLKMSGRVAASFYLPEAGLKEFERSEILLCREAEGVAARCSEFSTRPR